MLTSFLNNNTDKDFLASIHFDLVEMHSILNNTVEIERHKREAITLYSELYSQKPRYEYKKRIDELNNMGSTGA